MRQFSRERLLAALVIALFCFLLLGASWISIQQRNRLRATTLRDLQGDLNLISFASREALLRSDADSVRKVVRQWAKSRKELRDVRVTAPGGEQIAEYRGSVPASGETFSLSRDVTAGGAALATIEILGDYQESERTIAGMRRRLLTAAVMFTMLLGAALWLILRNMAIAPLEEIVNERTKALYESNRELEQISNNSPT